MGSPVWPPFLTEDETALVEAITRLEPALERDVILTAILEACSSSAKRRRAARAVAADPGLLTCGRPAGPVAVDHVLHQLARRAAVNIVLPACPGCGNVTDLSEGLDDTRVCRPCKHRARRARQSCAICGGSPTICQDRQGRAVCRRCRPGQDIDPVEAVVALVAPLAEGIDPDRLRVCVSGLAHAPYDLLRLSWTIEDRPALLTGEGQYGTPLVIRLIAALTDLGAPGIVAPPCPGCGVVRPLGHLNQGLRICKPCHRKNRQMPCGDCGHRAEPAGRTDDGAPICGNCLAARPENRIACVRCGKLAQAGQRTAEGMLCRGCYRPPLAICTLCGQARHCAGVAAGTARCGSCSRTKKPCVRCGKALQAAARIPDGYLCHTCWEKDPASFKTCTTCAAVERLYHHGRCARCACERRVTSLLAGEDGSTPRPGLEPLQHALTSSDEPRTILAWLARPTAAALLPLLGTPDAPLDHATLDQHVPDQPVEHLRAVLVTSGILPARDERLIQLQRWIADRIGELDHGDDRKILRAFATWNQLGRLRHRTGETPITATQADAVQAAVRTAQLLLTWLRASQLTLGTCTQQHLDTWLATGTTFRTHARAFVRWATSTKRAHGLDIPAPSRLNPVPPIDDQARWDLIRRFLHDADVATIDRVSGLLMLLFAQPAVTIAALRADQITQADGRTTVLLGDKPLELPDELGRLITTQLATRHNQSLIGRQDLSPWLFPGRYAGQHMNPAQISRRLKDLGLATRAGRHAAILDLSSQLPAAVLSRLLGISVSAASRWRQTHGDWSAYAAEISERQAARTSPLEPHPTISSTQPLPGDGKPP